MKHLIFTCNLLLIVCTINAQKNNYQPVIIAFYNLENFYDTVNNPSVIDEEFLPTGDKHYNSKIYFDKVTHLATVIAQIGTDINTDGPALLGVAEIENDTVLTDLAHHPLLAKRDYHFIHYESKDIRGIDVALLYNPKYFTYEKSKQVYVKLPENTKDKFFTRDILYVKGKLNGETVHILVNHWPSRKGGEERSAPARNAAAMMNKILIDSIEHTDSLAKIIMMGDLNDDPTSASITKILSPSTKIENTKPYQLYNPWFELYKQGIGTLAYNDTWSLFDQILINYNWLDKKQNGLFFYQSNIFKKDFMIENEGRYKGYPMRTWDGNNYRGGYSDHFPTYIVLLKKLP